MGRQYAGDFNPRAPRGARPVTYCQYGDARIFQSTRPSRGATIFYRGHQPPQAISIHAPLAGRDRRCWKTLSPLSNFNPRAPRGARPPVLENLVPIIQFQSTRPSRGATSRHCSPVIRLVFQSTRPSRGATIGRVESVRLRPISIHAPLAGRDEQKNRIMSLFGYFNPRAPRGARHSSAVSCFKSGKISIHAPLAGRDSM